MSIPMTPAQAAQQSNRDGGGRYQSKTHAEAEVSLDRQDEPMAPSMDAPTMDALNVTIGGREAGQPFRVTQWEAGDGDHRVRLQEMDGSVIRDFRAADFDEANQVVKDASRLGFTTTEPSGGWEWVQLEDGSQAQTITLDYDDVQTELNSLAAESLIERALPEDMARTHTVHQGIGNDAEIIGEMVHGPSWRVTTQGIASGQELHLEDHGIKAEKIVARAGDGTETVLWDAQAQHVASLEDGDRAAVLLHRTTLAAIVDASTYDEDAGYETRSRLAEATGRPVLGEVTPERSRAHYHAISALEEVGVSGERVGAASYAVQGRADADGFTDDAVTVSAVTYDEAGYRRVRSFGRDETGAYRELEVLELPDDTLPDEGLLDQRERALTVNGVLRTARRGDVAPLRIEQTEGGPVLHGWSE